MSQRFKNRNPRGQTMTIQHIDEATFQPIEQAPSDAPAVETELPVTESSPDTIAAEAVAEEPVAEEVVIAEPVGEVTVQTEVPVVEVKLPEPTPVPVVEKQPESVQPVVQTTGDSDADFLAGVRLTGTPLQKSIIGALDLFCDRMAPRKPITEEAAIRAQGDLLGWFERILNAPIGEFKQAWAVVLLYFKVNHGNSNSPSSYSALSEYRSASFLDKWADEDRSIAFVDLMTLARATRVVETRKHDIKRIALDRVAPGFLDEEKLNKLKNFYGV